MTHVICRLTAKNRDQLRNPTLGSGVWATLTFLLYSADTCTLLSADVRTLDAFHGNSTRSVWDSCLESDGTTESEIMKYFSGPVWLHCPITYSVDASRYLGTWLDLTTSHRQTWLFSCTSTYHSTDLLTARGVAHLVVHGTTGSTSYETIPHVRLESSGGVRLSTVDMVVQRRDGPRRLRELDDDDDYQTERNEMYHSWAYALYFAYLKPHLLPGIKRVLSDTSTLQQDSALTHRAPNC